MLDLASKAAINFLEWHVSIQASNREFKLKKKAVILPRRLINLSDKIVGFVIKVNFSTNHHNIHDMQNFFLHIGYIGKTKNKFQIFLFNILEK
jgi:hypothetical protein